jgi:hypothetical protein
MRFSTAVEGDGSNAMRENRPSRYCIFRVHIARSMPCASHRQNAEIARADSRYK